MEMLTASTTRWEPPPEALRLGLNDVHVWRAPLNWPEAALRRVWPTLSDEERAQARRFYFDSDRRRYVAAHGLLRRILSRYAEAPPERLRFQRGVHGKPALIGAPLQFNLSHTSDALVCAVARNRGVGVDVESIRPEFEYEAMAGRIFSVRELAAWSALPAADKPGAFFRGWVRKEAYVKALGAGLAWPVSQCEALLTPDQYFDGRWSWQPLDLGLRYAGALVVEGEGRQFNGWDWAEPYNHLC